MYDRVMSFELRVVSSLTAHSPLTTGFPSLQTDLDCTYLKPGGLKAPGYSSPRLSDGTYVSCELLSYES